MPEPDNSLEKERELLAAVANKGAGTKIKTYAKLCGPGWLQGAITLGGGSLSGALYLGVLMGLGMMWLQPLAMILGVIMLSAITYVTLSTGQRPFQAINQHVSPVLGWGWLIATLMANIVWSLPQFALGTAAVQQNLFPALEGDTGKYIICAILLAIAVTVIWLYDAGGKGVKIFEGILKIMVAVVVLSFFGVVTIMTIKGGLNWGEIFAGFIPNFNMLSEPAPLLKEAIAATGESANAWTELIVAKQRDVMITAFATAVGINMTFLLPYSMLRKRWGREHRGLAIFDLSTGLVIPFVIATGCVVIAAASQFHGKPGDIFSEGKVSPSMADAFNKVIDGKLAKSDETFKELSPADKQKARDSLPMEEKQVAAMIASRDAFDLANALKPLTGNFFAQKVFGIGVLGMAISTIIILMLISGFTFCEMLNRSGSRSVFRTGALIAGIGVIGPFIWKGDAKLALAIPTSVIGGALLPIAYFTFFLLMNSRNVVGSDMVTGSRRLRWNILMGAATLIAGAASIWSTWPKSFKGIPFGKIAVFALIAMLAIGLISFLRKNRSQQE